MASAVAVPDVATLSAAALASERTLPVDTAFASLLGGSQAVLVRGQVVSCRGPAAATFAIALAAEPVRQGAWLVLVDVTWLEVEAAAELGVPLERVVGVGTSTSPAAWVEAMGAVVDGFDLIITSIPRVGAAQIRRVLQRVTSRGAVLLTVPPPSATVASRDRHRPPGATVAPRDTSGFTPDVVIDVVDTEWTGLGDGHGHLTGRRVRAVATGRRWPRQRSAALWLPAPSGRIEPVEQVDEPAGAIRWEIAPEDHPA
jgi:hypothetical protein